ncbi:MAG: hypothetical protein ACRDZZ_05860 [Ilumatobacteraceae bacterium]
MKARSSRTRWARRFGPLIVAAGLVACGGDDRDAAPVEPDRVDAAGGTEALVVLAEDIRFGAAEYRVASGPVTIAFENAGVLEHTLLIEGVGGFELEVEGNGATDSGTVVLEPGDYTVYCDVSGHRNAGMESALHVDGHATDEHGTG